jgi:hypothetical protein
MRINFDHEKINCLAKQWSIAKIMVFGSVLRDDFGPRSDVDILIKFLDNAQVDLLDFVDIQEQLELIFGRKVDLVEEGTVVNPYRKKNIEANTEIIYAAAR